MVKNKKGQISTVEVAAAWGLAVMVMIYTLGHISGAHFNPAITLALASSCRFPWKQVPGYVGAQVAGSTLAVLTLRVMFSNQDVDIKGTVATRLQGSLSTLQGFLWEFIISFILMLAVCGVAVDTRAVRMYSIYMHMHMHMHLLLCNLEMTGASMNPARSVGAALVSKEFDNLWVYVVAPILGMLTATTIYNILLTTQVSHNNHKNKQTGHS
ncbi:Aquaporin NIP1-1 [Linum perenne]